MPSNMSNSTEGQSGQDAPQPPTGAQYQAKSPQAEGYAGGESPRQPPHGEPKNGHGAEADKGPQNGPDFAALLENPQQLVEECLGAFTQYARENPVATAVGCIALGFSLGYALRSR